MSDRCYCGAPYAVKERAREEIEPFIRWLSRSVGDEGLPDMAIEALKRHLGKYLVDCFPDCPKCSWPLGVCECQHCEECGEQPSLCECEKEKTNV